MARSSIIAKKNQRRVQRRKQVHVPHSNSDDSLMSIDSNLRRIPRSDVKFGDLPALFRIARSPYQEPDSTLYLGKMCFFCTHCGASFWIHERVASSNTKTPSFTSCCAQNKVQLPLLQQPPEPLHRLLTDQSTEARKFQSHIGTYNAALSFASVGVNVDTDVNLGTGPPIFRIHGELHHRTGALLPTPGQSPVYAQLYITDPSSALEIRMMRNPTCDQNVMEALQKMLLTHDPYADIYLHAYEVLNALDSPDYSVHLCVAPGHDRRRYNLPTADEVGVIIPNRENPFSGDHRDILLTLRTEMESDMEGHVYPQLKRITEGHSAYSPLAYVLLFPRGEPGWHWSMTLTSGKRLTLRQHTAFRIHYRPSEFNSILHGRYLCQRYLCDMFAAIDQSRLKFIRHNLQKKLRMAFADGLEDTINNQDSTLQDLGQRIILPASYIGGPRDHYQRFQDGMAIARYFKKTDLFITMTANPNWKEITEALLPGQTANDRPDIVARIFHQKKNYLLRCLTKGKIFGDTAAYVYAIEFQKRGLPHVHILLFLQQPHKLRTVEDVDSIISAEWPDPETQPQLFEAVKKYMVHGPCGELNPHAPCMVNGKCERGYPKAHQEFTTFQDNGYPLYRRRASQPAYYVHGHWLTNIWLVPNCPWTTVELDCHLNIECPVCFGSMKYLNKYVEKGGDCGTLEIHNEKDEITRYVDGRYFSAAEAAWRIFEFTLHEQVPNVIRLQVHLPNQQTIVFDPKDNPTKLASRARTKETSLTAFFAANKDQGALGRQARKLLYTEFPQFFTLTTNGDKASWHIRQGPKALGRMIYIRPTAGEKFYLRTLLTAVRGATSFDDLKQDDQGNIAPTFHDACLARGLLQDDGEWRLCLEDACEMQTGSQLRYLFSSLLLFGELSKPDELWHEFRHDICDDIEYLLSKQKRTVKEPALIYDYGLYLIDGILQESGFSLRNFSKMPMWSHPWNEELNNPLLIEQRNYNTETENALAETQIAMCNFDQQVAYQNVWNSVLNNKKQLFFLDGFGGTGKTFLYNVLCHSIRARGWIVLCVASTGLAGILLPGGHTAHSVFKIPIETLNESSFCNIAKHTQRAELLRLTRLIIFDECLMLHHFCFEALDRTLRDIRDCDELMGGITTVLGGDWQQILPVVPHGSREEIVEASLRNSYIWPQTHILKLRINMRLNLASAEERNFAQWLLDVGHGKLNDEKSQVKIPSELVTFDEDCLIHNIYGGMFNLAQAPPPQYFWERGILAPKNIDVRMLNEKILEQMPGTVKTCFSADSILHEPGIDNIDNDVPNEYLNSLDPANLPLAALNLKEGCPLILLRNLAPSQGLCNGTRLILQHITTRVLEVTILGGDHHNQRAFIPRITLYSNAKLDYPFAWRRHQFPVRLGFAFTINKAQGQSLKIVGIDLRQPVFTHGQLYVALSRATSSKCIKVLLDELNSNHKEHRVLNVVYPEVLVD